MTDPRRRRRRLGALLVAAALALAGLWLARGPDREVRTARATAPPPPVAAAPPLTGPVPPEEERSELPEAVRRYLESTVYPPGSGSLEPGAVDLLQPNRRYERMRPVPGAVGRYEFLWTADAFRYTSDEVVHARFEAAAGAEPAPIRELEAFARPEGRAGASGDPIPLSFRREGGAEVADLDLERELADHHGPVRLVARYAVGDEPLAEETIRIFVTPAGRIPARFTGTFRDEARDGSLVVDVGIEVDEPGFYRFDANLYDASGAPVAWAVYKGELGRHDGTVPLRFFGRVLRDAGRPGPYQVRQLRGYLFRDGEFPDRLQVRDYEGSHTTRAYRLSAFSDAEWDDPHRRRMTELLMEDARRGLSVDVPAPAEAAGGPADDAPPTSAH